MASVIDVQFEHYHAPNTLGVQESTPRLSWRIQDDQATSEQGGYEVELTQYGPGLETQHRLAVKCKSQKSSLVPWPFNEPLRSRQKISIRIRVWDNQGYTSPWSEPAHLETGLLARSDWTCGRITAPWGPGTKDPDPELNGKRAGDHFLAPGWTAYDGRLQYQAYDVTSMLADGDNCIGVRVAEGWFSGRIGFEGGHRNIWGPHTALLAQLEVTYADGQVAKITTDGSWKVTRGPIRMAEIYDGEKYDATQEVAFWSTPSIEPISPRWEVVLKLAPLPESTQLVAGFSEPVRRVEVLKPATKITTPKGKTVIDFGQNLVGYLRLTGIKGPRNHKITLRHAEVMEDGELGVRPLRICEATDEYTLKGSDQGESYEPRFTFHGFRYAQIDGWLSELDLSCVEAVVCHTDMKLAGDFSCSDPLLNQLYKNVVWGMRGNFLSVPTDCPQRDERLGWSGDLALFAPTACLIYDCFGMLKNWLIDLEYDQHVLNGVPPMVSPNATLPDPVWCRRVPCAIWHDVTILAPWALYQETGDESILAQQYHSMKTWMKVLPRSESGLWDPKPFQLGDWLDPVAPPDRPWRSATDAKMVSNMFLIQSLDLMAKIAGILGNMTEQESYAANSQAVQAEFQAEYVSRNGRLVSDSQAAYALAICLDILSPAQRLRAGTRLVELVRKNEFKVGTGFAGTPFLCEALAATGHIQVAYAMLLEKGCPSWLYPVTMGATTVWERWDSMLPDGSINPGEMTSFNHYAFGAIAKFMYERVAGLKQLEPGLKKFRIGPPIGAEFSSASASHLSPQGTISFSWTTKRADGDHEEIDLDVAIPPHTRAEIVIPDGKGEKIQEVGPGEWSFKSTFTRDYEWPILPLPPKS
ncbi:bacterial alpha-L-rhamnosidase-domain-containing protein [Ilyonectria destructans]|nr:bacterial alpha-L-rhamnosidase-domain-containing protein [Ilyonectria destructans]